MPVRRRYQRGIRRTRRSGCTPSYLRGRDDGTKSFPRTTWPHDSVRGTTAVASCVGRKSSTPSFPRRREPSGFVTSIVTTSVCGNGLYSPHPLHGRGASHFLCLAKESNQRKACPRRRPLRGCPALLGRAGGRPNSHDRGCAAPRASNIGRPKPRPALRCLASSRAGAPSFLGRPKPSCRSRASEMSSAPSSRAGKSQHHCRRSREGGNPVALSFGLSKLRRTAMVVVSAQTATAVASEPSAAPRVNVEARLSSDGANRYHPR